jgi:hypothetical protein
MSKQTAVQYLIELIRKGEKLEITPTKCGHMIYAEDDIIEKVLQMEKEQIIAAWNEGIYHTLDKEYLTKPRYKDAEDYYNKVHSQP